MRQAKRDLENAKFEPGGGFYEWNCFPSQQAAEKAVEALFQKLSAEAFGHSVAGCRRGSGGLVDAAKEPDKAYMPTRCPNSHPAGPPFEACAEAEAAGMWQEDRRIL